MAAKIISQTDGKLTLQVEVDISGPMLDIEESILTACNEVGCLSTEVALLQFDADGSPLQVGGVKFSSRGKSNKTYQTPYGVIKIQRHLYQTCEGGKTYCPLESSARIIHGSTPRFAKILSNKYAKMNAPETISDLEENHGRKTTLSFLQNVADAVGSIAMAKEENWEYHVPELEEPIKTVSVSLDGAHVLMHEDGYRESMVGTISLYDYEGERQHSIYIGAAPEYGKATFWERFEREIAHVKKHYPEALWLGIADGAKDNWPFLEKHTEKQLIDFYHVTEYLADASHAVSPEKTGKPKRKEWLDEQCHRLKHKRDGPQKILEELKRLSRRRKISQEQKGKVKAAVTYFTNNIHRMKYADHVKKNLPIGSGVTEAACKTLVKQRLCCSGMRWKSRGIKLVMSLRSLVLTDGRWNQFWDKIKQYGVPPIA